MSSGSEVSILGVATGLIYLVYIVVTWTTMLASNERFLALGICRLSSLESHKLSLMRTFGKLRSDAECREAQRPRGQGANREKQTH